MKFAVGYQLPEEGEEPLVDVVREFREHIDEVYFPWLDMPTGRLPMSGVRGITNEEARERLESDLRAFRRADVRLNLLFNASCYGKHAFSHTLADRVRSIVSHLCETVGLDVITTMSPMIARLLKDEFPDIGVRASVNMRLGEVRAFEYVADLFDGFTMQREYNRDFDRIRELKSWCDREGKSLHILANSGCLSFCAVQTFHDNLVSHEARLDVDDCIVDDSPAFCWRHFRRPENRVDFLRNTWIRPEDVHHWEPYFSVMKLATRMHANPRRVIRAYCEERFTGNLPDLLEPGHGPVFAPYVIDNSRFPDDWFERTSRCRNRCETCDYCATVLERVLVNVEALGPVPRNPRR